MAETYSVVVTGRVAEGVEREQAKAKVGKLFKLGDAQLEKLFAGKPVAVRRGVAREQADKICSALNKAGAIARVQSSAPVAAAQAPSIQAPSAQTPGRQVPKAAASNRAQDNAEAFCPDLECPRCGHEQPFAAACSLCKMDLTLHIQRLKRRERARALRQREGAR